VDVERVDAVDRGWSDLSTVLEPTPVPEGTGRAALWCRTEAVLKREGTGFAAPPSGDVLERGVVDDLVAPDGYCAAVAYDVP
jgi:4'-phosphopantetheinyl transferase